MTLSSWLRDYIFLPSAYSFSRVLKKEKYAGIRSDKLIYTFSIFLTFFVCGIWHGIGWNYIIWGELFAFFLVFDRFTAKSRKQIYGNRALKAFPTMYSWSRILTTFLLVSFTWVFFRAAGTVEALAILRNTLTPWSGLSELKGLMTGGSFPGCAGFRGFDLILVLLFVPLVTILEYGFYERNLWVKFQSLNLPLRWGVYLLFVLMIMGFGVFDSVSFIYFKF